MNAGTFVPGTSLWVDCVSQDTYATSTFQQGVARRGLGMNGATAAAVARIRGERGLFAWDEWTLFYSTVGLAWIETDLPGDMDGFIYQDTVFFQRDLCANALAFIAWHEAGHYMLHDGSQEWWSGAPQGDLTVARFERQANLFAAMFPVWADGE